MKKVLVIALAAVVVLACSLAAAAVDPFRGILASIVLGSKIVTNPVGWSVEVLTTEYDPVEDAYDTADELIADTTTVDGLIADVTNLVARMLPALEEGYTGGGGGPSAACQ